MNYIQPDTVFYLYFVNLHVHMIMHNIIYVHLCRWQCWVIMH